MKKIFSIFAAMLLASSMMAAVINIDNTTPDALRTALNSAADADEIVMAAGTYVESNSNYIAFDGKAVTVKAAEGAEVIIQPQVPITVFNGGHAIFENVKIDASRLTELADWYEHLLYVNDANPNGFTFRGCELYGFNINKSMFYCNGTNKLALAKFENCYFHDIMKSILYVENTEGKPMVSVKNCTFENIIAPAVESYYAGVIDVRAAEATLQVDKCTFYNVVPMNTDYSAVSKIALAKGTVTNCIFMLPTAQDGIRAMRGVTATNCITFNYLKDGGTGIHSSVTPTNCVQVDPAFVDPDNGNFTLGEGSPALTMNDGQPIGDPRWIPSDEPALENGYYLVGTMNNWQVEAEYKLVLNEAADDTEYMYDITFAEEDRFKVVDYQNGNWTWHPGEGDGYVIDADHVGEATVYFRPNGKEGWYYTIIYVAMKEEPVDAPYFAYTVTETIAKNTETAATGGTILFGADKFETMDGTELFGYKLDGNPSESGTKYVLCKLDRPLAAGDVISITGFASSNPKEGQAFQVSLDRAGSQVVGTAATTVAKAIETVDIPVNAVAVDATEFYITRVSASVYFTGVEVHAEAGPGTGVDNIKSADAAHKMIIDGKLVIIKNGVRYNVMGMQIR